MKLELLKAIITDLHLAGIHDMPSESFMNQGKIDSQELIKAIFNKTADLDIETMGSNEDFNEAAISSELNDLFATFGSGQRPDLGNIETIQTKAPVVKKTRKVERTIIDPRNKGQAHTKFEPEAVVAKKVIKKVVNFKPADFISSKLEENAKLALILPYKNEHALKNKADFNLLENILKAAGTNYSQISAIFIDDSYKKITQGIEKEEQKLAQTLENELKLIKQQIILCFGQDCLDLASSNKTTIRQAKEKVLDVVENKKLLANYSLSAMVNTPKYKSATWTNLLLINKINSK